MKEILHLTHPESIGCKEMISTIDKFIEENPEIKYSKIDSTADKNLYNYYTKKYNLPTVFPIFIGMVDGTMQDGHLGVATPLILKSLVG